MSKEAIKNLLMDFMADYDPNKWSNDDVYEKYAEKIDNVRSMGELIAITELTKKVKALEHRLSNCIEPKYKLNQDVFVIIQKVVRKTNISSIRIFEGYELSYYCKYVDGERMYLELDENEIFLTEAEAKAKLRSLEDDSL